jgi:O-antigen/teichoic acid export membrane protein
MSNRKKILSGIGIDLVGSILATIVGFSVVPFYFNYISNEEFGLWLAISGFSALITMVDLGTDQYLTTITASDEKFFASDYGDYLTSILFIKTIVSFLFGFIGVIMYLFLTNFLVIEPNYLEEAKLSFLIGIVILVLSGYFSTISTILYARKHYIFINSIIAISSMFSSFGTIGLLYFRFGIVSFPLALLIMSIIQNIILFVYLVKTYPHIKLKIKNFQFVDKKDIIGYTTTFQILRWVHTLRTQYITIAINNLIGPLYVAQYTLTNKIPQLVPGYALKIVNPFFPIIADLFYKGEVKEIQEVFIKISKVLFRIGLFFAIVIFFLNESFVTLWVGKDKFAGSMVILFLTIYMFVYVSFGAFGIVIYASRKFEKWAKWSIVEIVLTVVFSYLFSFSYGLLGIVFGFLLGSMVTQFYLFGIVLRQLNLTKLFFLNLTLKYSISSNILPLLFGFFLLNFLHVNSWITFVIVGFGFVFFGFMVDFINIYKSKEVGIKNKIYKVFMP